MNHKKSLVVFINYFEIGDSNVCTAMDKNSADFQVSCSGSCSESRVSAKAIRKVHSHLSHVEKKFEYLSVALSRSDNQRLLSGFSER